MNENDFKIRKLLHKLFRNDVTTQEITRVTGRQIDELELSIKEITKQNFLDSATWGVDIFENELGLKHVKSKPLEDRRTVISAKWRGIGTLTLELIKRTVDAYINGDVEVKFSGVIEIDFSSKFGRPPNIEDVYNTIEEIKPAHLGVRYSFRFRTHSEVGRYRHKELKYYTHRQIREEVLPIYQKFVDIKNKKSTHEQLNSNTHEKIRNQIVDR